MLATSFYLTLEKQNSDYAHSGSAIVLKARRYRIR
jgi:hypothetical protein